MKQRVLAVADLPVGKSACVKVENTEIAIFHQPEGIFALAARCPHKHGPMHEGTIDDGIVSCPWHEWQFRLSDGVSPSIPGVKIKSYPIEVKDGEVWVEVSES